MFCTHVSPCVAAGNLAFRFATGPAPNPRAIIGAGSHTAESTKSCRAYLTINSQISARAAVPNLHITPRKHRITARLGPVGYALDRRLEHIHVRSGKGIARSEGC